MSDHLTRRFALATFAAAIVFLAASTVAPWGHAEGEAAVAPARGVAIAQEGLHALRVKKCERLVLTFYPHSGFMPYVDFFISEHERLGMGEAWYWSAVYGGANFSLQVGGRAPGNCCGPMDVKHWPLVTDPEANIRHHCREMHGFWKQGVRGRDLCKSVFYPRAPRDWDKDRDGRGRFERTDAKFRACIARGYKFGKL